MSGLTAASRRYEAILDQAATERKRAQSRDRSLRHWHKDHPPVCRDCGGPRPKFKQLCDECRPLSTAASIARWREKAKSQPPGACIECGRRKERRMRQRRCDACHAEWSIERAMKAKVRRNREIVRERRALGVCVRCGWFSNGLTYCEAHAAEANARRILKESGVHWLLAERDGGWVCRYCGLLLSRDTAQLDRVLPGDQGGEYAADNLVLACRACNGRKSGRTPEQAGMALA